MKKSNPTGQVERQDIDEVVVLLEAILVELRNSNEWKLREANGRTLRSSLR